MTLDLSAVQGLDTIGDAEVRDAVVELTEMIRSSFPEAEAQVAPNPDYRGAILTVVSTKTTSSRSWRR
jgi:hypothetical protein